MRVVFKIVTGPKTSAASGSARYITDRDRNPKLEDPATRSLFTPEEEQIKWRAANSYLSGRPTTAPRTRDLHHLVLSFDSEDAKDLERFDDLDRDKPYRLITRQAMTKIAARLNASDVKWVAGVHRHTAHPHIHLILHKEALDPSTGGSKRITRFPREMLNDRDEAGDPVAGIVNLEFSEAIDGLLRRERGHEGDGRNDLTAQIPGSHDNPTAQNVGSHAPTQKLGNPHDAPAPKEPEAATPARGSHPEADGAAAPAEARRSDETGGRPTRHVARLSVAHYLLSPNAEEPDYQATQGRQPTLTPAAPTAPEATPVAQNLGNDRTPVAQNLGNSSAEGARADEAAPEKNDPAREPSESDRAADFVSPAHNPFISPAAEELSDRGQTTQPAQPDIDDGFDIDF